MTFEDEQQELIARGFGPGSGVWKEKTMVHDEAYQIASLDKELARQEYRTWYEEDQVSPDELLDKRLELMRARDEKALNKQLEEAVA